MKTGYYVSVQSGTRRGLLLGPYTTRGEALRHVPEGKRLTREVDRFAHFYAYGTARVTGSTLPQGTLNHRAAKVIV